MEEFNFSVQGELQSDFVVSSNIPQDCDLESVGFVRYSLCLASGCRFNNDGACDFRKIAIGEQGNCLQYEERTEDHMRECFAKSGLNQQGVELAIKELKMKGFFNGGSH